MLHRLNFHVKRHLVSSSRVKNRVASHRYIAAATLDTNEKLVQNLALVLDNNPLAAKEIGRAIGSESAERMRKLIEKQNQVSPSPPTRHQLRMVALASSIPYFGFGVLDNALMIVLGEAIDMTLCVRFGFSTMVAAALGNTFSDAVGVYSGAAVEDLAAKYGFEAPRLTRAQEGLPTTKTFERLGQLSGVVIGCLVGMFPLLFVDTEYAENLKREKVMDEMYQVVVDDFVKLLDCEAAMLLLVDHEKKEIYPRSSSDKNLESFRLPIGVGTSGTCAKTGEFLRIDDLPNCPEFYRPARHDNFFGSGIKVQSVLCWPILGIDPADGCGKVVGVLQVINKRTTDGGFTDKDEEICAALSTHISATMATSLGLDYGFQKTLQNCESSMQMRGRRLNTAEDRKLRNIYEQVLHDCTDALRADATFLLVSDPACPTDEWKYMASDDLQSFHHGSLPIFDKCKNDRAPCCLNDLAQCEVCDKEMYAGYQGTSTCMKSVFAHPCFSSDGKVIAVLGCLKGDRNSSPHFSSDDGRFLKVVASNIASSLQRDEANLQRFLKQIERHPIPSDSQPREAPQILQEDRNNETYAIGGSIIDLVRKAREQVVIGQANQAFHRLHSAP